MSDLYDRLGYLLKHAQIGLSEHTGPALARLRVDGRELAVLTVLSEASRAGGHDPEGGGPGGRHAGSADQEDRAGRQGGQVLAEAAAGGGNPALAQHEAAEKLGVDRTTMVELIDGLEGKGLVRRRPDPADRRRKLVHLTDRGRAAVADGGRAAREAEQAFLAALTPAEAEQLRDLLRRAIGAPVRPDSDISG